MYCSYSNLQPETQEPKDNSQHRGSQIACSHRGVGWVENIAVDPTKRVWEKQESYVTHLLKEKDKGVSYIPSCDIQEQSS